MRVQVMVQAARALAQDDPSMVSKVLCSMPELEQYIFVNRYGHVALRDANGFDQLYEQIYKAHLESQLDEANAEGPRKPRGGRTSMLTRWLKMRLPFDAKLVLSGIQRTDHTVATEPEERAQLLADFWAPVFKKQPIDKKLAKAILKDHQNPYTGNQNIVLEDLHFTEFLRRARHSATGPDGVPYLALLKGSPKVATSLRLVTEHLMAGGNPAEDFNESFIALPAKDTKEEDKTAVVRPPDETRPLNLKNCDNKTCTGVINEILSDELPRWACKEQRGFVRYRQGLDNIIGMDTSARVLDFQCSEVLGDPLTSSDSSCDLMARTFQIAFLVLFDFKTAFPSVAYAYLVLCLHIGQFPEDIIRFFKAIYKNNKVFINIDGVVKYFCNVESGVLQGCTGSGSFFVIALNPILHMISQLTKLEKHERVRAFADDLAAALKSIYALKPLKLIFDIANKIANLELKIPKCVFIPLGAPVTEALKQQVRMGIEQVVPEWSSFKISDKGRYLGIWLGPGAHDNIWKEAQDKYVARSSSIAAAQTAPSLGVKIYNERAFPTLSYIAQIYPPLLLSFVLRSRYNRKSCMFQTTRSPQLFGFEVD